MCNSPVLLIFFNRPETLREVFEQIRKAEPSRLYLAQDGARDERDMAAIKECRAIVDNIDWDCQVFRRYSVYNQGCGIGPYNAISWVFENEEQAIVLEDDCVASQSFFRFCDEMLSLYKEDERVFLVTGCNLELKSSVATSYFFGNAGTNWGWATWKRNWDKIDYSCEWVNDRDILRSVRKRIANVSRRAAREEIAIFKKTNALVSAGKNISYWDVQWQAVRYLNNQLSIIPSVNFITNIGIGATSTHAKKISSPKLIYNKIGNVNFFFNENYDSSFELCHPKYMVRNIKYDAKVYKKNYPGFFKKIIGRIMQKFKL